MTIKDLRISKFEKVSEYIPVGGSGTGYSTYTTIKVIFDNNMEEIVTISTFYTPYDMLIKELKDQLYSKFLSKGYYIIFNQDTIDKFLTLIKN